MSITISKSKSNKSKIDLEKFTKQAQYIFDNEVKKQIARASSSNASKVTIKCNNPL